MQLTMVDRKSSDRLEYVDNWLQGEVVEKQHSVVSEELVEGDNIMTGSRERRVERRQARLSCEQIILKNSSKQQFWKELWKNSEVDQWSNFSRKDMSKLMKIKWQQKFPKNALPKSVLFWMIIFQKPFYQYE